MSRSAKSKAALFSVLSVGAAVALTAVAVAHTSAPVQDEIQEYLSAPLVAGDEHFPSGVPAGQDWAGSDFDIWASAEVGQDLAGNHALALASARQGDHEAHKEDIVCLNSVQPESSPGGPVAHTTCQVWGLAEEGGLYSASMSPDGYYLFAFVPGAESAALEATGQPNGNEVEAGQVELAGSMVEAMGTWEGEAGQGSVEVVVSRPAAAEVRIELSQAEIDS